MRAKTRKEKYLCDSCGKEIALSDKHWCTEIIIDKKSCIADLCDECYEKVMPPIKESVQKIFRAVK